MAAPVSRLNLEALVAAKAVESLNASEAKSSPHFIPLHLKEVQEEQAPGEGETVIVTPRSRSNSFASSKNTPRADSTGSLTATGSPRASNSSGGAVNVDRLHTCAECGAFFSPKWKASCARRGAAHRFPCGGSQRTALLTTHVWDDGASMRECECGTRRTRGPRAHPGRVQLAMHGEDANSRQGRGLFARFQLPSLAQRVISRTLSKIPPMATRFDPRPLSKVRAHVQIGRLKVSSDRR